MLAKKRGFTILEIILASLILVITVLGGAAFLSANKKNLVLANRQNLATWAAVSKMEELKSSPYVSLASLPTENITLSGKSFQRTVAVEEIDEDADGGTDYKKITVTVTYSGGGVSSVPVSMVTYIAPR